MTRPELIPTADIAFHGRHNTVILSPRQGGRVISWIHGGSDELVHPLQNLEGGLFRVLFAEERYPGASYVTPHLVHEHEQTPTGFRVRLRHFWNTTNALLRLMGWHEKINPLYLDGLLLDKTLIFDDPRSLFTIELTLTNLSGETKIFTPWLHSAFAPWTTEGFVVQDGCQVPYQVRHIFWGSHTLDGVKQARLVQTGPSLALVLGAPGAGLAGLAGHWPPELQQSSAELRYRQVRLKPGASWRAIAFLGVGADWRNIAEAMPTTHLETAPGTTSEFHPDSLLPLLADWALPQERNQGLMILSFLDKGPFTSLSRFAASHLFGGFHPDGQAARAWITLFALRDLREIRIALAAPSDWRLDPRAAGPASMKAGDMAKLALLAPADLSGRERVEVRVQACDAEPIVLTVPTDAAVGPEYPYQVKPFSTYLEERFRTLHGPFTGTTAAQLRDWLQALRTRHQKWLHDAILGDCDLAPRLVERQLGDTCVRDKVLVQTEPGLWMPAYVIYPKNPPAKMPAILFTPGSGPGKMDMAPDDDRAAYKIAADPVHGAEYAYLPYRLAIEMNCLVYVPDQRGWGEQAETNLPQMGLRCRLSGVNYHALRIWDHIRHVDYLCSRSDVDASRLGCFGASGGGLATLYTAGIDERIAAAIVSSTHQELPETPDHFFQDMWTEEKARVHPSAGLPAASAFTAALTIPRPLWIMDGVRDECVADPKDPRAPEIWAAWRRRADAARAEIARLYALAGVPERFDATWFDYGHCGGMNLGNVSRWFRRWLG